MHTNHTTRASLQALYRIFVLPALSRPNTQRSIRHAIPPQTTTPTSIRAFSQTATQNSKSRPPEKRAQNWDHEIRAREIYLIDPITNRRSERTHTRFDILKSLDLRTHRLVQVTPDDDKDHPIPLCKVVNKKEAFDQERKRKEETKEQKKLAKVAGEAGEKTMELNWAIDENDLGHRLGKMQGFLEEGRRVEVVFNSKKRGRKATREECLGVIARVRGIVEEVKGAKVRSDLEGVLGKFAKMELQGAPVAVQKKEANTNGESGKSGKAVEEAP
ncbi:hypothetical protein B0A50_07601 [Lecanosticta acicola]|uniref:Translation initiation factor 3 N-terminal domain-containing protein n=1 Tax=Lecanosticta acicola TaxID=111012 RepID=A0AAI8YXD3_9PEZI|nr:hypothetical protein B0A50_07601 [Lecanosticta acicola]